MIALRDRQPPWPIWATHADQECALLVPSTRTLVVDTSDPESGARGISWWTDPGRVFPPRHTAAVERREARLVVFARRSIDQAEPVASARATRVSNGRG